MCNIHMPTDSLRYTSALSVSLAVVFLVVIAGITVYKLLSGKIMMPRLLPEAIGLTSVLKLFTAVPVLVTAYICHYNGYVDVGKLELSLNHNYLAYTTEDEMFMLQVKNLKIGFRENFRVDDVDQLGGLLYTRTRSYQQYNNIYRDAQCKMYMKLNGSLKEMVCLPYVPLNFQLMEVPRYQARATEEQVKQQQQSRLSATTVAKATQ